MLSISGLCITNLQFAWLWPSFVLLSKPENFKKMNFLLATEDATQEPSPSERYLNASFEEPTPNVLYELNQLSEDEVDEFDEVELELEQSSSIHYEDESLIATKESEAAALQ